KGSRLISDSAKSRSWKSRLGSGGMFAVGDGGAAEARAAAAAAGLGAAGAGPPPGGGAATLTEGSSPQAVKRAAARRGRRPADTRRARAPQRDQRCKVLEFNVLLLDAGRPRRPWSRGRRWRGTRPRLRRARPSST